MGMRTIRWRNGQCPGRNGQWAERIAHAGSGAVRLVPLFCGCCFPAGSAESGSAGSASPVSGRLAVGGPLGQRAVGCLCLGPFHFYHRGAVRLSRQRQRGVIEQSGAQGAAPGHKSREAAPAREGASLKGGLGAD